MKSILGWREPTARTDAWYELPAGGKLAKATKAKPVLVAAGKLVFPAAGIGKLMVKLTAQGKQLLRHGKRLKLEAKGTFRGSGGAAVSALRGSWLGLTRRSQPRSTPGTAETDDPAAQPIQGSALWRFLVQRLNVQVGHIDYASVQGSIGHRRVAHWSKEANRTQRQPKTADLCRRMRKGQIHMPEQAD